MNGLQFFHVQIAGTCINITGKLLFPFLFTEQDQLLKCIFMIVFCIGANQGENNCAQLDLE